MQETETGIPCFECGERSGIDCTGRRLNEATRCKVCMEKFMKEEARVREEFFDGFDISTFIKLTTNVPTFKDEDYEKWISSIVRDLGLPAHLVQPPNGHV